MRCRALLWFPAPTALRAQQPGPPAPDSTRAESTHALPAPPAPAAPAALAPPTPEQQRDRKSTRLNSSHGYISYAVFCLKKKNNANGAIPILAHHARAEQDSHSL